MTRVIPIEMKRRGVELSLVIEGETSAAKRPDPSLLKAVARGYRWFSELASGRAASIREIAKREVVYDSYVKRLIPLALLAPASRTSPGSTLASSRTPSLQFAARSAALRRRTASIQRLVATRVKYPRGLAIGSEHPSQNPETVHDVPAPGLRRPIRGQSIGGSREKAGVGTAQKNR